MAYRKIRGFRLWLGEFVLYWTPDGMKSFTFACPFFMFSYLRNMPFDPDMRVFHLGVLAWPMDEGGFLCKFNWKWKFPIATAQISSAGGNY